SPAGSRRGIFRVYRALVTQRRATGTPVERRGRRRGGRRCLPGSGSWDRGREPWHLRLADKAAVLVTVALSARGRPGHPELRSPKRGGKSPSENWTDSPG